MSTNTLNEPLVSPDSAPPVSAEDIASMRPLLIRASAGTGKTYQLTGRLLRILLSGATADTVIATTFTRKAAGEILNRVLLSLAKAATDESDKALKQLASQTGVEDLRRDQCVTLAHSLLRDIHRLRIMTLDSLFSQLARSFSYEIGVPPGWRLTDEIEDESMREAAVDVMIASLASSELLTILAQLGKGDNKRSVRSEILRVVNDGYQVSRGCDPSAWDSLQVPVGPSKEAMNECITSLGQASVGHKSADSNLRALSAKIDAGLWDAVGKVPLVTSMPLRGEHDAIDYYRKVLPPEIVKALRVASRALKTHVLGLLRAQTEATGKVITSYQSHVVTLKQSTRAFSFDDVAHRLADSLQPFSMNQIASRMDGAIDHLLLDEFQDTSPVQWNVLKPMALSTARPATAGSFFCVGDTKQAIYGWRGGVAEIFDQVCEQISGVVQRAQNTSYRSSPVIMDAVNLIFRNLQRHPVASPSDDETSDEQGKAMRSALTRFSDAFPTHDSAKPTLEGYVRFRTSDANGENADAKKFTHLKYVAERIAEAAAASPDRSIGVLTRTNSSVAWLIQLLRRANVDVSQEGGNPLVDSPAVELVLSALMMPEHPGDRRWAFHVAHSPLADWLGLDRFDESDAASDRVRRMVEDKGIARCVEEIAGQIVGQCDEGDALRLRQLVYLAQQYETNRGTRISDFVYLVQNKRVEKPRPAQVRVMTIHQAKGLEFDIVVLPELDGDLIQTLSGTIGLRDAIDKPPRALLRYIGKDSWPLLPDEWQRCFSEQVEAKFTESMCLLYVALTRARQCLEVIVQPSKHAVPTSKTASALLYHATSCDSDATVPKLTWFELGNPAWDAVS